MAQQSGMMSLLVQDVNGKPQVIKVQTSQTKSVTTAGIRPNQTIRAVIKHEDGTQILSNTGSIIPQGQVLRTLSTFQGTKTGQQRGHLVTIPIQTPSGMKVQAQVIQRSVQKSFFQPVLDQSATRKRPEGENGIITQYKRRRTDKCGKGLRHFSMKVMEKVKKKGTTSYNEVADELVTEFSNQQILTSSSEQYDQKNIRRRVYDALNVLMAMNIISKEKKEIRWLGLPTNSMQDYLSLVKVKTETTKRIKTKTQQLHDLILQQISFKKLVERNYEAERRGGVPPPNSSIQLPFIIVNTNKKAVIDCSISNDKTEYLFAFNDKFEIHDDIEVLKRMGLVMGLDNGTCSNEDFEKAKSMVPKSVEKYVVQLANGSLHCESMAGPSSEDLAAVATLEEIQQSMSPLALDPEAESSEGDESDLSSDLDAV